MVSLFSSEQEWDEFVTGARRSEASGSGRIEYWRILYRGDRREFSVSLVLFLLVNVLAFLPWLTPAYLSDHAPLTGIRGFFLGLLIRPGLDIVCWICAFNALQDVRMKAVERVFCNVWFAFLCLWSIAVFLGLDIFIRGPRAYFGVA